MFQRVGRKATTDGHDYLLSWDTSPHVLASLSSESESAAVHRSLKISERGREEGEDN